jgi:hypothetical protein
LNACQLNAQIVFDRACAYASRADLQAEIEWQRNAHFESFCETQLLREAAWVILCSGFREGIVRRIFNHISLCFFDWEDASSIVKNREICVRAARASLNYDLKLQAIVSCAEVIATEGFEPFKRCVLRDPVGELQRLPFIGPITVFHLAKNLGFNIAKPDRHLVRLAASCGFGSAFELCDDLAARNNQEAKVVDLILWRFLADNPAPVNGGSDEMYVAD